VIQYDPEIYNVDSLLSCITSLKEFCDMNGLDFVTIYNDYMDRYASEDWKLEEQIHRTESSSLIYEYYKSTRMYLYELTLQECRWDYIELFYSIAKFAKEKKVKKALDFGGGIGGLTKYLNSRGVRCDYADIPGNTWDYAGYRFQQEGIACSQLSMGDLKNKQYGYDLIVSLDCLEHLNPLSEYINFFSTLLSKDGILLVKSAFFGNGLHLESNYKYNDLKVFNEMVAGNNLIFQGQLVTRMRLNFILSRIVLTVLNQKTSSGRKLVYRKAT